MEAIIRYPDGRRVEVVVVSIARHVIDVVPVGGSRAMQLTFDFGLWTDEDGVPVEFEALFATDPGDVRQVRAYLGQERASGSGGAAND